MSAVADYIRHLLRTPEVRELKGRTHTLENTESRRARKGSTPRAVDKDAHVGEIALVSSSYLRVKGPWLAEDVEPHLQPLRSSLDPAIMERFATDWEEGE